MSNTTWGIAGAGVLLAGVFTVGALWNRPPEPAPLPCSQSAPSPAPGPAEVALREKAQTLEAREREMEAQARLLAERERALTARSVAAVPKPEEPKPVLKEPSPEETAQTEVLESVRKAAELMSQAMEAAEKRDATPQGVGKASPSEEDELKMGSELMATMTTLNKHKGSLHGDLAADMVSTFFDALMPGDLKISEDQKGRFRQTYLQAEQELEMYRIPKERLLSNSVPFLGQGAPLNPEQKARFQEVNARMAQQAFGLLTPGQQKKLESNDGRSVRINLGGTEEAP